jgi:hypothetical protein
LHSIVRALEEDAPAETLEELVRHREAVAPIFPAIDPDLWIGAR